MLEEYPILEFLVLPGHHLYRMDYQKLIDAHRNKKSDVTCAVLTTMINHDSEYGIFKVNFENKVTEFSEKPEKKVVKSISVIFFTSFFTYNHLFVPCDYMVLLILLLTS